MKIRNPVILPFGRGSRTSRYQILIVLAVFGAIFFIHESAICQQFTPSEWKFESQRKAIAPMRYLDGNILFNGLKTLALKGGGKEFANGHWYNTFRVEPGQYFQFRAYFISSGVEEPNRSILATINWQDSTGMLVGEAEYPALLRKRTKDGWAIIEQLYKIPDGAVTAKIELHYRWDANGAVHFGDVSLLKSNPPTPRNVKIATVFYRPGGSKTSMENLEKFSRMIDRAAVLKADIVCLPEEMTLVGTGLDYVTASEPVPGPSTAFLGTLAKKYHLYIVAGLLEKKDGVVYNTSVLIDRSGHLAGKYRKISLPKEEIDGGVSPGDVLPVFKTDFGRIGMMICWDVTFPETARKLARQGAEIIFLPIWGGNVTLARARAIENQVYLVSSSYNMVTAVFDKEGEIMKEATKEEPVIVVEVDLNNQKLWPGIGDFKNRIMSEMPPHKTIRN